MILFTDTNMAEALRAKCDSAKNRIWIVSPFVGDANDVDCILGKNWRNSDIDRKLLFDSISGSMPKETFESFNTFGIQIRSLHSIHAKIFIVDDWCLISSANLTGSAFSKRHEIGTVIDSSIDLNIILEKFNLWWNTSDSVTGFQNINQIVTKNNFKKICNLPQSTSLAIKTDYPNKRLLKPGEYIINGINLWTNVCMRKCLLLKCTTDNDVFSCDCFVAIYDKEIINKYNSYLTSKGTMVLNYEQCQELPNNLRYINYMKKKVFTLPKPHVRRYVNAVSNGTYGVLDNYDGWEYDCAMSQPPPKTGMWWIDEIEEKAWLENPFPLEAIPAQHLNINVHIRCNPNDKNIDDEEFERIKNYMLEDFYTEYTPDKFPHRRNRMH